MCDSAESKENKRPRDDDNDTDDTDSTDTETYDSDSDSFVKLSLAVSPAKKRKLLPCAKFHLESLPCADSYEKSYMHKDTITHCIVTASDFIVTASCDGHMKFWKKVESGIEFVKHFQSHLGPIVEIACNCEGTLLCSASLDKSLYIFDVINFKMINTLELDYIPGTVEWIHNTGDPIESLAVSDKESPNIYVYDGRSDGAHLKVLDNIHRNPVSLIKYNPKYDVAISADKKGMLEYWTGTKQDYIFPKNVGFHSKKLCTDLFDFKKKRTFPCSLAFSRDGKKFATTSPDRRVRVFHFFTGKLIRVLDETISRFIKHQHLPEIEFCRRMAVERNLEKSESFELANITFDESGYFIMYATVMGIKLINIHTNRCIRIMGKNENMRMLNIALYQGSTKATHSESILICTAYKDSRLYLFSRRKRSKSQGDHRDGLNKLSKQNDSPLQRLYNVIRTPCSYS